MHAVKRFRHDMGCRLATYAMWWIRAAMQDFILKSWSLLKIPLNSELKKKLFYSLNKERNRIKNLELAMISNDSESGNRKAVADSKNRESLANLANDFDIAQISEPKIAKTGGSNDQNSIATNYNANMLPNKIADLNFPLIQPVKNSGNRQNKSDSLSIDTLKNSRYLLAMDHVIHSSEDSKTFGETVQDENATNQENVVIEDQEMERRKIILAKAIQTLNPREKEVIVERRLAANPVTLTKLAERYGISTERVRQIEAKAMHKLSQTATAFADTKL